MQTTNAMNRLIILLVLSVSAMAQPNNECSFGSEVIQPLYDRFVVFKAKAFDPTDSNIPLEKYQFYVENFEKRLSMKINGVTLTEESRVDSNRIHGQYEGVRVVLDYESDGNGEFSFTDLSSGSQFKSRLGSIEADLPSNLDPEYKTLLAEFSALRQKIFDFQQGLSKEDLERVQSFLLFPAGSGFHAEYTESGSWGVLKVDQTSASNISGKYSCLIRDQKYNIVDGKVITDGEPFRVPISPRT